jgi:hypothetical protein
MYDVELILFMVCVPDIAGVGHMHDVAIARVVFFRYVHTSALCFNVRREADLLL